MLSGGSMGFTLAATSALMKNVRAKAPSPVRLVRRRSGFPEERVILRMYRTPFLRGVRCFLPVQFNSETTDAIPRDDFLACAEAQLYPPNPRSVPGVPESRKP